MHQSVQFLEVTAPDADVLAPAIAAMDPWHRLKISEASIKAMLLSAETAEIQRTMAIDNRPVGAIVVRSNWLLGPYLKHLSVLPAASGLGIGTAALNWLVSMADERGHKNIWLCVSKFNTRAQQFYARNGFKQTAVLEDLVMPGEDEILMRRRLI